MKKDTNSVDDFFRKSLQDHQITPSEAARSRFLDEAGPAATSIWHSIFRWYYMLAAAVILSALGFLYFGFLHDEVAPAPGKTELQNTTIHPKNTDSESIASTPDKKMHPVNSGIIQPSTQPKTAEIINPISQAAIASVTKKEDALLKTEKGFIEVPEKKNAITENGVLLENILLTSDSSNIIPGESERISSAKNQESLALDAQPDSLIGLISNANPDQDSVGRPPSKPQDQPKPQPQPALSPFSFTPYLFYGVDWNPDNKDNPFVHSLGFEGKIQYNRFSLTAGVGVTSTTAHSNYEVQYNDYLGNYQKLDSITFVWDQKGYNLVPTYYMSDTKVWDSAIKFDSYQEEKRYNQLRIPVLIGYDFLSTEKFVLGLKTGIEMLLYLKSTTVTEYEYMAGQNKLVGINPLPDSYARNNFWFMANFSASYYFSRRIVFEVEPRLQFLLNPDKTAASQSSQEDVLPAIRASLKIKF
jgi:hypothetical protein